MSSSTPKVWFITGCSSGFGASLVLEILRRGDKVIATARDAAKLDKLKEAGAETMQFDVTAPLENLMQLGQQAHQIHGRIDYLINNAGYVLQGTFEELTPSEIQKQFDTNVFGLINVTKAILPFMRAARSGVIGNISSIGGWKGFPGVGVYAASKWAVSGVSESVTFELAEFGIKVCCIEPGYFRSNLLNSGNRKQELSRIQDYDATIARKTANSLDSVDNNQPGDVKKGAKVIVDVLTCKGGKDVPLRLALGSDGYQTIVQKCIETKALLDEWKDVSSSTDHDDVKT